MEYASSQAAPPFYSSSSISVSAVTPGSFFGPALLAVVMEAAVCSLAEFLLVLSQWKEVQPVGTVEDLDQSQN